MNRKTIQTGATRVTSVYPQRNPEAPENGVDRCPCGCKYWRGRTCIDCGGTWYPEDRERGA